MDNSSSVWGIRDSLSVNNNFRIPFSPRASRDLQVGSGWATTVLKIKIQFWINKSHHLKSKKRNEPIVARRRTMAIEHFILKSFVSKKRAKIKFFCGKKSKKEIYKQRKHFDWCFNLKSSYLLYESALKGTNNLLSFSLSFFWIVLLSFINFLLPSFFFFLFLNQLLFFLFFFALFFAFNCNSVFKSSIFQKRQDLLSIREKTQFFFFFANKWKINKKKKKRNSKTFGSFF